MPDGPDTIVHRKYVMKRLMFSVARLHRHITAYTVMMCSKVSPFFFLNFDLELKLKNFRSLKRHCHKMNNFFEGLKNQISTFCICADGF
jgi:hypothetical protein